MKTLLIALALLAAVPAATRMFDDPIPQCLPVCNGEK